MASSTAMDNSKDTPSSSVTEDPRPTQMPYDPSLSYRGSRSLATVSSYGLLLGLVIGVCLCATLYLVARDDVYTPLWRLPFFVATLCNFHFLEFYTTARFNTPVAKVSSYLLFSANGWAWNVAHSCAILEILFTRSTIVLTQPLRTMLPRNNLIIGAVALVLGQALRTRAMTVAGTNFNHIPVRTRAKSHVLVKHDVYAWFRHPSYCGFFYWAIGTQMVVDNVFCSCIYIIVLWRFFNDRIMREEELLVKFFGDDYVQYRRKVGTGIPFIK